MLYAHRTLLLTLFIFNISFSADPSEHNETQINILNTTPLYVPEITNNIENETNIFSEEDIEEMELALQSAPNKIKILIKNLQDPTYYPQSQAFKTAYFIGDDRSDKTITAKAIAYEMSKKGWDCSTISPISILEERNDKFSIILQSKLQKIETSNKPTIVIIEELDQLLENSHFKHRDLHTSSAVLCEFIKKQKHNNQLFLIGTMSYADHLPNLLKNQMILNLTQFPLIEDTKTKNELLRQYLATEKMPLNEQITDDFLNQELEKIGSCSRNNLKQISTRILITKKLIETHFLDEIKNKSDEDLLMMQKDMIEFTLHRYVEDKKLLDFDRTRNYR